MRPASRPPRITRPKLVFPIGILREQSSPELRLERGRRNRSSEPTRREHCDSRRKGGGIHTVLRISTCELYRVLPNRPTRWNPAFTNMDSVPWVDSLPKARVSQRVMG